MATDIPVKNNATRARDSFSVDKIAFDPAKVRAEFPILQQMVHGKPLAFLDNAASTQKPEAVIEEIANYYRMENANIHRGVYYLSQVATEEYESPAVRGKMQRGALHLTICARRPLTGCAHYLRSEPGRKKLLQCGPPGRRCAPCSSINQPGSNRSKAPGVL